MYALNIFSIIPWQWRRNRGSSRLIESTGERGFHTWQLPSAMSSDTSNVILRFLCFCRTSNKITTCSIIPSAWRSSVVIRLTTYKPLRFNRFQDFRMIKSTNICVFCIPSVWCSIFVIGLTNYRYRHSRFHDFRMMNKAKEYVWFWGVPLVWRSIFVIRPSKYSDSRAQDFRMINLCKEFTYFRECSHCQGLLLG